MSETHVITIIVLLSITILVLLWIAASLGSISRQLQHTPRQTTSKPASNPESPTANPNSDFERFLAEDPERQFLPKKEQAAAFRDWRKQHGLTWKSGDP